ncbi:hypothetical protein L7F22_048291 [Adiantum nelumboides]|nr:hypothetical protein [Adiantum nelumboides]
MWKYVMTAADFSANEMIGTQEDVRFWCCFGPDDYRGQVPKPHAKRRATKGKHFVGCQCHFVVSQLYLFPDVAKINYIRYEHIDGSGNICHGDLYDGPMNKLKFAPRLSSQMRDWVCNLLQRGFTPQQILTQHIQRAERCSMEGILCTTRDLFLTMHDILNITCMMENVSLHTHQDDAVSVSNWVIDNPDHVFYYQSMNEKKMKLSFLESKQSGNCKCSTSMVMMACLQWMQPLEQTNIRHAYILSFPSFFASLVSIDLTSYPCTCLLCQQFYLYTILVFDAFRNGVPIAWAITSSACQSNITTWLAALRNRVLNLHKGWEPNAFMVDDAEADIQALREVFGIGIPILLCIWHVQRAWLKNLVKKVADATLRVDMFRQLGLIMNMRGSPCQSLHDKESEAHKLVVDFMVKYESEVLFIDYFKREWLPRIGMWIRSSRMMRIANQDTNGSIEAYHGILKSKFLGGRRSIHGRQVDWLIKMLVSSCHSYFWYHEMLKDAGFKKNFKVMDVVKNSLARAMEIPDEYVRFHGAKSMQSIIEPFDSLDHFSPIAHVDSPPNKSSSCKENDGKDYVSLIQNNILQSLQIAGNESSLLKHIHRLSVQILASTQQMKASESCMPLHPLGELQRIEDGFGTSLKRAKPFIEKGYHKRKKPCKEQGNEGLSFPICPQRKRVKMQNQLDMQARVEEDNV